VPKIDQVLENAESFVDGGRTPQQIKGEIKRGKIMDAGVRHCVAKSVLPSLCCQVCVAKSVLPSLG